MIMNLSSFKMLIWVESSHCLSSWTVGTFLGLDHFGGLNTLWVHFWGPCTRSEDVGSVLAEGSAHDGSFAREGRVAMGNA